MIDYTEFRKKQEHPTYINPITGDKVQLLKGYEDKYSKIIITKVNYALPNRSEIVNATIKGIKADKSLRAFAGVFIKVSYISKQQMIGMTSYYIQVELLYMIQEQQ